VTSAATDADGSPTTAAIGIAELVANGLLAVGTGLVEPVVWSRPKMEPGTTPPEYLRYGSSHDIVSQTVADTFAVLRSRRD
jgi:hypothetical protein